MRKILFAAALALSVTATAQAPVPDKPHNLIIFVCDGLRYGSVTPQDTPNLWKLKTEGVDFVNSHSLYPTVTTANASAIATGHYIGDTGNFANTIWVGAQMLTMNGAPFARLENDMVLEEMRQRYGGNYLNETSLFAAARAKGWQTAVLGKTGPSRIQDLTASSDGTDTLIVDDTTGQAGAIGLPSWYTSQLQTSNVKLTTPASTMPDIEQELHLIRATTRIVLPHFAQSGAPFALLFWSRDPDLTQHGARDSLDEYEPGINGPSALAAVRNADTMLGLLMQALKNKGLDKTTDIFVTADHGFVTAVHISATSPSAHLDPATSRRDLKSGFLATDLAIALHMQLNGDALLGPDLKNPDAVIAANGGSDLIYLPKDNARDLAGRIVEFLSTQDYVSGIFINDRLGKVAGTLPMSAVNLIGAARTPAPDIYVNFRTFAGRCGDSLQCELGVHDTGLATGQGSHGSLSRGETRNFMAAFGPDFKTGFTDPAPVSNADIAPTLARISGIDLTSKGKLSGRVISEALVGGAAVKVKESTLVSDPAPSGIRTILEYQTVDDHRYFDAGGFEGRTVGLTTP